MAMPIATGTSAMVPVVMAFWTLVNAWLEPMIFSTGIWTTWPATISAPA